MPWVSIPKNEKAKPISKWPSAVVEKHLRRVKQEGLSVREQLNVNCCYANQSKFWVIDPDGVEWELYHVNHNLIEKHGGGIEEPKPDAGYHSTAEMA